MNDPLAPVYTLEHREAEKNLLRARAVVPFPLGYKGEIEIRKETVEKDGKSWIYDAVEVSPRSPEFKKKICDS